MSTVLRLWQEEDGAIISSELVLIATLLVIGIVTGLSAVRDAVVTELADVADAIGVLNQSFSFGGSTGHHSATAASAFIDAPDSCDAAGANGAQVGPVSSCIAICTSPASPG